MDTLTINVVPLQKQKSVIEINKIKKISLAVITSVALCYGAVGVNKGYTAVEEIREEMAIESRIEDNKLILNKALANIESASKQAILAINKVKAVKKSFAKTMLSDLEKEKKEVIEYLQNEQLLAQENYESNIRSQIMKIMQYESSANNFIAKREIIRKYPTAYDDYSFLKKQYNLKYRQMGRHPEFQKHNFERFNPRMSEVTNYLNANKEYVRLQNAIKKAQEVVTYNNNIGKAKPAVTVVPITPARKEVVQVQATPEPVAVVAHKTVVEPVVQPVVVTAVEPVQQVVKSVINTGKMTINAVDSDGRPVRNAKVYLLGIKDSYSKGVELRQGLYKVKVKASGKQSVTKTLSLDGANKSFKIVMSTASKAVTFKPVVVKNGQKYNIKDGSFKVDGKAFRNGSKLKYGKHTLEFTRQNIETINTEFTVKDSTSVIQITATEVNQVKDAGKKIFGGIKGFFN